MQSGLLRGNTRLRVAGRHLLGVCLALAASTCHGAPPHDGSRAVAQATPRTFDPRDAAPDAALRELRAQLASDPSAARRSAEAALGRARGVAAGRLRWIAAEAARAMGDEEAGRAHLRALGASPHPLAPWAALRLAEALEGTEPAEARVLAAALAARDWPGARAAAHVEARVRLASGDIEGGREALRALVASTPAHIGAASAALPLAEDLAASERTEDREEALALFRRVATRAPRARVGQDAATRATALLATLPAERRRALATPSIDDRFAEAEALAQSMHHQDAEAAFRALARELEGVDEARRCDAEARQGAAAIRRRARADGSALLRRVAARCDDLEIKAWARFRAGRALFQLGRNDEAWAELEALEAESAAHTLADDARFRLALVARDRGDAETTTRLLSSIPERYPAGDMRGEALFVLALDARAVGQAEVALGHLDRLVDGGLRAVPGEEQEGLRGRAGYWRAKVLFELGRQGDAFAGWDATARAWPLSYYATHAGMRLREHAPDRARALERAFGREVSSERERLRFAWRAELDAAWFQRFLELGRVGAESEARRELEHAGALASDADEELVWLVAACLAEVGALPEVTRIVRRRLETFRHEMPVGRARALWRLAYPRAYAPLVETAASEAGVPASFVRAIAREESSFDPDAVSWAHAYGLVQVILPTARRHGASLGVPIDATSMRKPEVNLAVGSNFMRFLRDRYAENPGLVPAAYNAGHGAVDRWLRLGGELSLPRSFGADPGRTLELDELVERIPYDETRRYSRRVLQTWAVYSWLDEGRLLELPSALPRR